MSPYSTPTFQPAAGSARLAALNSMQQVTPASLLASGASSHWTLSQTPAQRPLSPHLPLLPATSMPSPIQRTVSGFVLASTQSAQSPAMSTVPPRRSQASASAPQHPHQSFSSPYNEHPPNLLAQSSVFAPVVHETLSAQASLAHRARNSPTGSPAAFVSGRLPFQTHQQAHDLNDYALYGTSTGTQHSDTRQPRRSWQSALELQPEHGRTCASQVPARQHNPESRSRKRASPTTSSSPGPRLIAPQNAASSPDSQRAAGNNTFSPCLLHRRPEYRSSGSPAPFGATIARVAQQAIDDALRSTSSDETDDSAHSIDAAEAMHERLHKRSFSLITSSSPSPSLPGGAHGKANTVVHAPPRRALETNSASSSGVSASLDSALHAATTGTRFLATMRTRRL